MNFNVKVCLDRKWGSEEFWLSCGERSHGLVTSAGVVRSSGHVGSSPTGGAVVLRNREKEKRISHFFRVNPPFSSSDSSFQGNSSSSPVYSAVTFLKTHFTVKLQWLNKVSTSIQFIPLTFHVDIDYFVLYLIFSHSSLFLFHIS